MQTEMFYDRKHDFLLEQVGEAASAEGGGAGALGEGASGAVDPVAIIPASQAVFIGALLCAIATAIIATTMPRDRPAATMGS